MIPLLSPNEKHINCDEALSVTLLILGFSLLLVISNILHYFFHQSVCKKYLIICNNKQTLGY